MLSSFSGLSSSSRLVSTFLLVSIAASPRIGRSGAPQSRWHFERNRTRRDVPSNGPPLVWKVKAWRRLFLARDFEGRSTRKSAREGRVRPRVDVANGNKLWKFRPAAHSQRSRTVQRHAHVDGDRLYVVTGSGNCSASTLPPGNAVVAGYGEGLRGSIPHWGYSESPLVDGNRLIVMPGGNGASLVSLDKMTGKLQWKAERFRGLFVRIPDAERALIAQALSPWRHAKSRG